jgi:quinoprotein glucose dehydrogenase
LTDKGSENYGGSIVIAGGLVFTGGESFNRKFRAFDKETGELLWETTLPLHVPARRRATRSAGGGKNNRAASGGGHVAFALPRPH